MHRLNLAAVMALLLMLSLLGCDPKPSDNLGLHKRGLVLARLGSTDRVAYWAMDGTQVVE